MANQFFYIPKGSPSPAPPKTKRKGDWMQTYTGFHFYPFDVRSEEVEIMDIAHALSMICQYGGHCSEFYSVAQHSVIASRFSDEPVVAMALLLHDAAEAYVGDVVRPIKYTIPFLREAEKKILAAIFRRFNLGNYKQYKEIVSLADRQLMIVEGRRLLGVDPRTEWEVCRGTPEPNIEIDECYLPIMVKQLFLERFDELQKAR